MVVPPLTARWRLTAQLDQCDVIRNRRQIEMFIHNAAPDAKVHGTRFRSSGQILCTQTHQGQRGIDAVRRGDHVVRTDQTPRAEKLQCIAIELIVVAQGGHPGIGACSKRRR